MHIDENSVSTTRELLTKIVPDGRWEVRIVSVSDVDPRDFGTFDFVYPRGVLHGDMWSAIEKAASFVRPEGKFAKCSAAWHPEFSACDWWRLNHSGFFLRYSCATVPPCLRRVN
jgi:hypothetical protein